MTNNKRRTPQLRKRRRVTGRADWNETLTSLIDISRILSSNLDIETIWDALHDYINMSFDTTSFFIALYDYERDRLDLPLVSEDGLRVEHEPIPVCGISRAVLIHGIEVYLRDVDTDTDRLASLGVEPDEREPGRWARSWIGVPLRSRQNEVIGVISLQNTIPESFHDEAISLLMALATPLSMTLDNLRLTETERERRMIAGALMEIGQLAGARLDYDDVLEQILDQLQRVISYDSGVILIKPSGDERQLIVGASHDPESFVKSAPLRYAEFSPLAQSLVSQQPVVIPEVEDFSEWWEGNIPESMPIRSWLMVPMTAQQEISGLILLGKQIASGYTQKDASSAFALARQGAVALEATRLQLQTQANLQTLQQRARRLGSINRITSVITSSLDRDEVFRTTAQLLTELFEADHCGIVMLNETGDEALLAAEFPDTGKRGMAIRMSDNTTFDSLIRYATGVSVEDREDSSVDDPTRDAMRQIGAYSTLFAPLIVNDRVTGAVTIDMLSTRRHFSNEECETLVTIAGQVAMAVSRANIYEDALAANRLRSAFLANISHELRTPLNAIIGYSEMLLGDFYGTLNEQQSERVTHINTSGNRLLNMIQDVLDLAQIEAGQITLSVKPLRVSQIVADAVAGVKPLADAKSLALEVNTSLVEPLVRADPQYMTQIALNLLNNAVKFTPSGNVKVGIEQATFNGGASAQVSPPEKVFVPDGDWVALRVTDTGIGIKPEDQAIIFESFRQVDNSLSREYEGSGLGLAITRLLVEMHQGYLWVDSALGSGSTFTVLLPVETDPGLTQMVAVLPRDLTDNRPLVLVIDDGTGDRESLAATLGDNEYQFVYGDSDNPLITRQLQPDVVIIDVADTWEVLRQLRTDEASSYIPIIVISALDQKTFGDEFGVDFLVEPVDAETLRERVERAVGGMG
jgi:signal transduction histidine kinase